jgi:hypothetical protein
VTESNRPRRGEISMRVNCSFLRVAVFGVLPAVASSVANGFSGGFHRRHGFKALAVAWNPSLLKNGVAFLVVAWLRFAVCRSAGVRLRFRASAECRSAGITECFIQLCRTRRTCRTRRHGIASARRTRRTRRIADRCVGAFEHDEDRSVARTAGARSAPRILSRTLKE